jgi:archaellum component FlaC
MMKNIVLAAALFTLMLFGCSGGQQEEMNNQIAAMNNEITGMETELARVKAQVGDLKSELSGCRDELQALLQEKMQEAETAVEGVMEDMPEIPELPAAGSESPTEIPAPPVEAQQ